MSLWQQSALKNLKSLMSGILWKFCNDPCIPRWSAYNFGNKYSIFDAKSFLMAELALFLSGSNSSVERFFSIQTLVPSDCCLGMSHDMKEKCMIITSNDKNWSKEEREILIHHDMMYICRKGEQQSSQAKTLILRSQICGNRGIWLIEVWYMTWKVWTVQEWMISINFPAFCGIFEYIWQPKILENSTKSWKICRNRPFLDF